MWRPTPRPSACWALPPGKAGGRRLGVVMVRVLGAWIEVATFRKESDYSDHRRPDRVEYTDAQHDALAARLYDERALLRPRGRRVIDYVGGQEDIGRCVIRAHR